jgi:hypothetical protein
MFKNLLVKNSFSFKIIEEAVQCSIRIIDPL